MEGLQAQVGEARDALAGALDYVLADVRQKWGEISGGPSVTDGLRAFVAAVDWSVSRRAGEGWREGWRAGAAAGGTAVPEKMQPTAGPSCWPACRLPTDSPTDCRPTAARPTARGLQERWIQGLLAFHLGLLICVVALRRLPLFHGAVFLGISESVELGAGPGCWAAVGGWSANRPPPHSFPLS